MDRSYRFADLDPDYRKVPKTDVWCHRCQKDMKPNQPRRWIAYEIDTFDVIHPEDFQAAKLDITERRAAYKGNPIIVGIVGNDCARKIGISFTKAEEYA